MLIVTVGILFSSKVYMVEAYQCSLQPHCGMRVSSKHKVEFYLLVDLAFLTKAYRSLSNHGQHGLRVTID